MTPEQAAKYRTVVIASTMDDILESYRKEEPIERKTGYFHRWVEKKFEVDDLFHSGRPQDAGIILKTKVQDCRALIEHSDGTLAYYQADQFKFTDRK